MFFKFGSRGSFFRKELSCLVVVFLFRVLIVFILEIFNMGFIIGGIVICIYYIFRFLRMLFDCFVEIYIFL